MPNPDYSKLATEARSRLRCVMTNNLCGTDTRPTDSPCTCVPCLLADAIDTLVKERICDCGHLISDHEDGALCHFCSCTVPLFFALPELARLKEENDRLREAIYVSITELEYSGHPIGHDKACSVADRLKSAALAHPTQEPQIDKN